MKKLVAAILTIAMIMTVGTSALAGTFDEFWDFEQEDGTYAYAFPRLKISMDGFWYQNTRVVVGEGGATASFYHKGSYNAFAEEGMVGGLLFTIGASVNTDFQDLPSYTYLGFDEEEMMNYYAELPTDYQAYMGDEAIRAEYDALWSDVKTVLAGVQIAGSAAAEEPRDTVEEAQPRSDFDGDYDYLISSGTATITGYSGDAAEIALPSEIDGCPVVGIEAEAFSYQKFKAVTIPDSIRVIGERAFEYCEISDSLRLPEGVTISRDAFSYAELPAVLVIPARASVEARAFSYCEGMERVCLDPNVTLEGRAFGYCDDLRQLVCAQGCRLEARAFEYCEEMETVLLCGDVQAEEASFSYCGEMKLSTGGEYEALKQSALDGSLGDNEHASAADLQRMFRALFTGNWGENKNVSPEETQLEIIGSPAILDGVTLTLERASAVKDQNGFTYKLAGSLENNSDEGISQVIYTIALIDEAGEEFRSFGLVYDGEDGVLPPHGSIEFDHDDISWGKQSVPAAVRVEISTVMTETELPPARLPRTGEFLYQALGNEKLANIQAEPPVELSFHVDQGGYGRTATFKEGEALDRALELFRAIRIGEETNEWVSDNYNWIWLTWEDGSQLYISLNLSNLEYYVHSTPHMYELDQLGAFWSYCEDYLEEDSD